MSEAAPPTFSVVVPVYNEEANVLPLFAEIHEVMTAVARPFEVIFVNDGSSDGTLVRLRDAASRSANLRILDLDGNFGEAAALCAGFGAARGDVVITLDGDGQNDPHDIPRLLETLEHDGYRVVSGWRQQRQEDLLVRVLPSRLANALIAVVSRIPVHDNGCGLKVYRRAVVAGASLPRGMNRFLPAILGVTAAQVAEVPVNDRRRQHGQSHYGLSRTIIVLRDLLALRFIIAHPRPAAPIAAGVAVVAAVLTVAAGLREAAGLTVFFAVVALVAALIAWNLRRFNRAQREGVYRIRREYSAAQGTS